MINIRKALATDAPQLAQLAERTFRDTFGATNTSEDLDHHSRTAYQPEIQAREIADPATATIVADQDGDLVAYAQLRWGDAAPCVRAVAPGEIHRLYVDKAWHGHGLAQKLMLACLAEMHARGSDVVWLGVWEHNPRAIAFYKKFAFQEVGAHTFVLGHDAQRDIILSRPTIVAELR